MMGEEYNSYFCFQVDLAVAAKASYDEAEAKRKAYEEAEQNAKNATENPQGNQPHAPGMPPQPSKPSQEQIQRAVDKVPQFDPNEILKRMQGFNMDAIANKEDFTKE